MNNWNDKERERYQEFLDSHKVFVIEDTPTHINPHLARDIVYHETDDKEIQCGYSSRVSGVTAVNRDGKPLRIWQEIVNKFIIRQGPSHRRVYRWNNEYKGYTLTSRLLSGETIVVTCGVGDANETYNMF